MIPGAFQVRGKDAFDSHIVDEGFVSKPAIDVTRLTEENDVVVAEGSVRTERTDGTRASFVFCDVFEMQRGEIRRLTSYLMEMKQLEGRLVAPVRLPRAQPRGQSCRARVLRMSTVVNERR